MLSFTPSLLWGPFKAKIREVRGLVQEKSVPGSGSGGQETDDLMASVAPGLEKALRPPADLLCVMKRITFALDTVPPGPGLTHSSLESRVSWA